MNEATSELLADANEIVREQLALAWREHIERVRDVLEAQWPERMERTLEETVAGLAARQAISVDDTRMIATSFPGFEQLMRNLGARFVVPNS